MPTVYQRAAAKRDLVENFIYLAESWTTDCAMRIDKVVVNAWPPSDETPPGNT